MSYPQDPLQCSSVGCRKDGFPLMLLSSGKCDGPQAASFCSLSPLLMVWPSRTGTSL